MKIDEISRAVDQGVARERRLRGLGVSPGIAIGPAYIAEGGDLAVRESHLPETVVVAARGLSGGADRGYPGGRQTAHPQSDQEALCPLFGVGRGCGHSRR